MPTEMEVVDFQTFKWGPWILIADTEPILEHTTSHYEVSLSEMVTSAKTLDWIMQIVQKTWADPETVSGFLSAIDDLISPQSTLCSGGHERRLSHEISSQFIKSKIVTKIHRTGSFENDEHPYIKKVVLPGEDKIETYPNYKELCLKILKDLKWGKITDEELEVIKRIEMSLEVSI